MSTAKLYPPQRGSTQSNPLPQLLQTPSGLALLELQGSFNLPQNENGEPLSEVEIGKLDFPDYNPDTEGSAWMQRAHLYVGQHQRLTGEIKKLPKAIAVVRRKEEKVEDRSGGEGEEQSNDLEVVEIVKYKLMFSNRPEPVGTANAP
ncbi:Fc.00g023520.m01.CDS01 [Cosmosporella sp. VM-42]